MEFSFHQLKQKDVINITDGKNLGKVCDISISFPECNFLGITVPGCKGFKWTNKRETFVFAKQIVQIGEDAILVKTEPDAPPCPPPKDKCPPLPCPPRPCPPREARPPFENNNRRDYGEYE